MGGDPGGWALFRLAVLLSPRLDLAEESAVDTDVLYGSCRRPDTRLILLEQPAEVIALDEVDGRGSVPGCFLLGV